MAITLHASRLFVVERYAPRCADAEMPNAPVGRITRVSDNAVRELTPKNWLPFLNALNAAISSAETLAAMGAVVDAHCTPFFYSEP